MTPTPTPAPGSPTPVPGSSTPIPGNHQDRGNPQPPNPCPADGHPFGPVIFSYTRKQAIEDGVLVDLTPWAAQTGFTIPVACTAAVWHQCIVPPEGTEAWGQSERGRAHDMLWMLYIAIRQQSGAADRLLYDVIFTNAQGQQETVQLKAICGPGDPPPPEGAPPEVRPPACEPVLTIMLPHED
jgi:hypothetical protein